MNSWKEAARLGMFEVKNTNPLRYLLWVGILILLVILMVPSVPDLLDTSNDLLDFIFVFCLYIFPYMSQPKTFKSQSLGGGWYASHHLITLKQLPIRNEIIVKSRFISYVFIIVSFIGLFLIGLYLFSPLLRSEVSVGSFVVFIIMFLCFHLLLGAAHVVSEAGSFLIISIVISLVIAMILVFSLSFFSTEYGLIAWLMLIAGSHPFLTIILSISLAFVGLKMLLKLAERRMTKVDYLL